MEYGVSRSPLSSHFFCLAANEKDFSHSLEMTNAGRRYSRIIAFFMRSPWRRHSPSFPWKEVPRRGGGWNRRGMKGNIRKAVSRIVIPSGAFAIRGRGFTLSPHVPRTSPLFSSVFHPARTLSGSLRSPPSPWGKAYDTGYAFLSFVFMPARVLLLLAIPQSCFSVCKEDFSLRSK